MVLCEHLFRFMVCRLSPKAAGFKVAECEHFKRRKTAKRRAEDSQNKYEYPDTKPGPLVDAIVVG